MYKNFICAKQVIKFRLGFPSNNVFVTCRVGSTLSYNISVSASVVKAYNLTLNRTNDVTTALFLRMRRDTDAVQLIGVAVAGRLYVGGENCEKDNNIEAGSIV